MCGRFAITQTDFIYLEKVLDSLGRLHDRMAIILPEAHIEDWLNPAENMDYLLALLSQPYSEEEMEAIKISRNVNSRRNQSADVLLPVS